MSRLVKPLINPNTPPEAIEAELERKFALQEQSYRTMRELLSESAPEAKRELYWKLRQINDALGIPTEAMAALGVAAPALEGGAA